MIASFRFRLLLLAVMLIGVGQGGWSATKPDDMKAATPVGHESHEIAALSGLTLNNGAKWQGDKTLRQSMDGVRRDLESVLPRIYNNTLSEKKYAALSESLQGHITHIIEHCKLPANADAQLHLLLQHLSAGAESLKNPATHRVGVSAILTTLDAYSRHFNHPNWKPLARQD